jgi:hypothetical protein
MNSHRTAVILILLLAAGLPSVAAQDGPDAREIERRKLVENIQNAKPVPNPMPKHFFTPEETASLEHRRIVVYDPSTKTKEVLPAGEAMAGTRIEPFMGLLADLPRGNTPEMDSGYAPEDVNPIYPLADATSFPYRTAVKLVMDFPFPDPDDRTACSGVMVDQFHVLTAGHCVYTWDLNGDEIEGDRAWADWVRVYPAQGDAVDPFNDPDPDDPDPEADWPYGIARAVMYRSYSGWTERPDRPDYNYDWAVLTLDRRVGWLTGWMGIRTGGPPSPLNFTGYPVQGEGQGFEGQIVQWYGWGNISDVNGFRVTLEAYSAGGHSGGPTWSFENGERWLRAVHSTSNRNDRRGDVLITEGKLADLNRYIADDWALRPPVDLPDLQECFFSSWGCYKNLETNVVEQGETIRLVYNVLNSGFVNSGDITVSFYLSANDRIEPWDIHLGSGTLGGLEPFTAYTQPIELTVPLSVPPGTYYVGWAVTSAVPEYDVWPDNNNVMVIADETLTVEPAHNLTVTSPNGGEIWDLGSQQVVTWDSYDAGNFVTIELTRDGGTTWEWLSGGTVNDGSFSWTVSGAPSDTCRIRITPLDHPGDADFSDADFRIVHSVVFVEVTSPNGGESWITGRPVEITWDSLLAGPTVRIELTRNGGFVWETLDPATPNDGRFAWTVTAPVSGNCRVRVTSTSVPTATDTSDGPFSIESVISSVLVISPNGGEQLSVGRPFDIEWSSLFLTGDVRIELSRTAGLTWETLVPATANDGLFTWDVAGPTTTSGRVRVTSVNDSYVTDMSDAPFSIVYVLSSISITSPIGGEVGFVGYPFEIAWNSAYVDGEVKIELSRDDGSTWETLAESTPNDGTFEWTVTSPNAGFCRVRISSVNNPIVNDTSDAFEIAHLVATLTLTSPNGGEVLYRTQSHNITWNSFLLVGDVALDLSRDGGSSWETIVASTANDGLFSWVVSGAISDDCLMRVRSLNTPVLFDVSNEAFTISSLTPMLQVDYPNGGESLRVGPPFDVIRWSSAGVTSQVAIDLTRDAGLTWETLSGGTANDGWQLWSVTGPETSEARLRIRALDDPAIEDTSDADFTISSLYDVMIHDVRRVGGGQLEFQWIDTDWEDEYEIYRGTLTAPFTYNHDTILACDIAGGTTLWVSPDDQETAQPSYYYLVVPHGLNTRVFGEDSDSVSRPPAATTCP